MSGIVVVAAAIGAISWGVITYNEITKIDRSEPEVVADEFLRAVVREDDHGIGLYGCSRQEEFRSLRALRSDLSKREEIFNVEIDVTWGAYARVGNTLTTRLTITARKNNAIESKNDETWRLDMIEEKGWRVCGATKVDDASN